MNANAATFDPTAFYQPMMSSNKPCDAWEKQDNWQTSWGGYSNGPLQPSQMWGGSWGTNTSSWGTQAINQVISPKMTTDGIVKKRSQEKDENGEDLPPVISVKKSAKGCAVILLRDEEVWERSVAQRVAVVDGVCIEVRNHTRSKVPVEEQEMGVFCAWGFRVERRAQVSEEGLEAYFNSLAGKTRPEGLEPKAPIEEKLCRFPLRSMSGATLNTKPEFQETEAAQLLGGLACDPGLVQALWDAKSRLDDHYHIPPPPMGKSLLLRVARAQLVPHSGEGSKDKEHDNRAGDKLAELSDEVGLLKGVPKGSVFLDLCGGPGAWSLFLLEDRELALQGYGLTLKSESGDAEDWHAQQKDDWYEELEARQDWHSLWGADGTGDLLKPGNLEQTTKFLKAKNVFMVVADGGFSDGAIPPNQQELYFYRLLLAELLTAISCLQPGGRFVCKLYSTFSEATAALLFLTTRVFEEVSIVKPKSSRVTGPERYLYAAGMKSGQEVEKVRKALLASHALGGAHSILAAPGISSIVSADDLVDDDCFLESLQAKAQELCGRQSQALTAAVDRAEFLEEVATEAAVTWEAPEGYEYIVAERESRRERGDRENRGERRGDRQHRRGDRENGGDRESRGDRVERSKENRSRNNRDGRGDQWGSEKASFKGSARFNSGARMR
jgi:23S rRNA U2552 (ribose-2'-O)-methylase RlmE/FtsJ